MDLIEKALRRDRFESHRYDGSMDVKKRSAAINAFKENSREPKVLVISLKAGGVGLNVSRHLMRQISCLKARLVNKREPCIHGEYRIPRMWLTLTVLM